MQLEAFPPGIRSGCFCYDRIKKLLRHEHHKLTEWKRLLSVELSRCEATIFPYSVMCCGRQLTNEECLVLCDVCSTAFRKACKKLQRHLGVSAMDFHARTLRSHKYSFLGGAKRTALLSAKRIDCPVCLESVEKYTILRCGHCVCITCTKQIWMDHVSVQTVPCPICRTVMVYNRTTMSFKNTRFIQALWPWPGP